MEQENNRLNKPFKYVYNKAQSIWFILNGAEYIDVDNNPSSNKIYFKFTNNETIQRLYDEWYARNK